ncbi:WGR domain-containing protein [Neiella sp. HB171785]|uniref:WGR domain-containing protein n=1 Tax=Neiella litorisoli TaxID=2771431 RepID=A0A8J6R2S3_9GAMM|nr:WGR domain-containing protein [Neiella litorisoli]MBD1389440.1 WGR domain-containing protein [Neiella litorisoli]
MSEVIESWYLEHHNSTANKHKFYRVNICRASNDAYDVYKEYGRIGTKGQSRLHASYATINAARSAAHTLVDAKTQSSRDRYELLQHTSPKSAPSKPTPKSTPKKAVARHLVAVRVTLSHVELASVDAGDFQRAITVVRPAFKVGLFDVVSVSDEPDSEIIEVLGKYHDQPDLVADGAAA